MSFLNWELKTLHYKWFTSYLQNRKKRFLSCSWGAEDLSRTILQPPRRVKKSRLRQLMVADHIIPGSLARVAGFIGKNAGFIGKNL